MKFIKHISCLWLPIIFVSCFYSESRVDLYIIAKTNLSEPVANALVVLNDKEIGFTDDKGILRSSNMLVQRRTYILKIMKKTKHESCLLYTSPSPRDS